MGFQKDNERMNAGGNGGGGWITVPGSYTVQITEAEEAYVAGRPRLKLIVADVVTGGKVRAGFDLDGTFAWRTDRLMEALGVDGYDHPADLIGRGFDAEVRLQRGTDRYMEIGRVSPASRPIPAIAKRGEAPPPPVADDEEGIF